MRVPEVGRGEGRVEKSAGTLEAAVDGIGLLSSSLTSTNHHQCTGRC